jgi:hypothetical protein
MRLRVALALALFSAPIVQLHSPPALAWTVDDAYAAADQAQAATGVSAARLLRVANCETGGTLDPYAVGDRGTSYGLAQIHVGGLWAHFHQLYSDPYSPYEALMYMARAFAGEFLGLGISSRAWSCA